MYFKGVRVMAFVKSKEHKDAEKLSAERGYLIVKRNDMIQKSRHQLNLQEQKILLFMISKIKPHENDFTEQVFSISEFCAVCGMDGDSGKNYSDIKKALQAIRNRSIWVTLDDGSEETLAWIDKVRIQKRSGLIHLRLDDMLKPYLLEIQENFTRYELLYTLAMRSQYSVRLYELLKSYQYKKYVVFDIDELKRLLFAEKYQINNDFKKRVLDIAVREINALTDISVTYSFGKIGRRFAEVSFSIDHKEVFDRWNAGKKTEQILDSKE
jgi:plasmid replication initiation protein